MYHAPRWSPSLGKPFVMNASPFVLDYRRRSFVIDGEITVGRDPSCDVVIVDDLQVSRCHAKFVVKNGIPTVEDLGSANGVYLNGARIRGSAPVQPGDVIRIGDERLTVFLSEWAERARAVTRPERGSGEATPSQRLAQEPAQEESDTKPYGMDRHHVRWLQIEDAIAKRDWEHAGALLRTQISRVMDEVSNEGALPQATQEQACRHVIDIALASGDGSWLDMLLDLHHKARQPLPNATAAILPRVVDAVRGIDLQAFESYLELLRASHAQLTPTQRRLCSSVESAYVIAVAHAEHA